MTEHDNHFTVFIRLPFKRGDFVDPPPVAWSAAKERELWDVISRQSKGNEIDWVTLAEQFQVTQQFLLQQAAWLYERQLSQVRAQMRRMGNRQSNTASPAPTSTVASVVGQASKKPGGPASRGPSRLSTQVPATTTSADTTSAPNTPARSRVSLPLKTTATPATTTSGGASSTVRGQAPGSRSLSRRSSRDIETASRTHSRRGSVQHQPSKSSGEMRLVESPSTSEDETTAKTSHRRPNPAGTQRRTSTRRSQHTRTSSITVQQLREAQEEDDEDDEDDPAFLPFASASSKPEHTLPNPSDPSATLRGIPTQTQPPSAPSSSQTLGSNRPALQRNRTSERVRAGPNPSTPSTTTSSTKQKEPHPATQAAAKSTQQLTSSTSSFSSASSPHPSTALPPRPTHRPNPTLPTPYSPRQQAALATAAGLSPRHQQTRGPTTTTITTNTTTTTTTTGSESSPSMGSSFSDLDDASVTQSALEEALMSNMNTLGTTLLGSAPGGAANTGGGLGSRVSGISQALRSRYFDARAQGPGQGMGQGRDLGGEGSGNGNGNVGGARGRGRER